MECLTLKERLLERMRREEACTIFTTNDFLDLADADTLRSYLSKLASEGKIERLIDGYFSMPYYVDSIQAYVKPPIQDLVIKIADRNVWKISPIGDSVLNNLGLSTQIPNTMEYISTGPYREYEYMNKEIRFKHTNNQILLSFSRELTMVIQAIKAIGKDNLSDEDFKRLCWYCKQYVKEDLIEDTKKTPTWIYRILKRIGEENKYE